MLELHDSGRSDSDPVLPWAISQFFSPFSSQSCDLHSPQSACPNCAHMTGQSTQWTDPVLSSSSIANTDFIPHESFGSTVTGYSFLKDFQYLSPQSQTREVKPLGEQISLDVLTCEQ